MNLYLLRHGQAEQSHINKSDASRSLTAQGADDIKSVAARFAETGKIIDRCFVSPLKRTQQTADIFLKTSAAKCVLETEDALRPENNSHVVLQFLEAINQQNILLVGHNPLMSGLYTLLTEGVIDYSVKILSPGELCGLHFEHLAIGLGEDILSISPNES
jgi:phosphohistidine phosphatase